MELLINKELACHVQEWLTLNKLTLNVKKIKFHFFKSHKRKPPKETFESTFDTTVRRIHQISRNHN